MELSALTAHELLDLMEKRKVKHTSDREYYRYILTELSKFVEWLETQLTNRQVKKQFWRDFVNSAETRKKTIDNIIKQLAPDVKIKKGGEE